MVRFIDRLRTKGSVMPSSRFLVRRMLAKMPLDRDLDVLQLGFGSGVFAHAILAAMTAHSTLTVFEVDAASRRYAISDNRLRYIEASAEHISDHCGTQQFDVIISSLPLASLPRPVTRTVLLQVRNHLKPGGTFLQYQYSLFSRGAIRDLFGVEPVIGFELLNFPPAFIYRVVRPGPLQS